MSHAAATYTPRGRLLLARCVVDQHWSYRRAAERFQVSPPTGVGGHEKLPGDGHEAARWRTSELPADGHGICPTRRRLPRRGPRLRPLPRVR